MTAKARPPAPPTSDAAPSGPDLRLKTLVPGGDFAVRLDPVPGAEAIAQGSRGVTVQNDGPPSESELRAGREATARVVKRRIEGWAADDLAEWRTRSGAVDDYFRVLGNALEAIAQVERPLALDVTAGLQRMADGYLKDVAQYGATGSPHLPAGDLPHHTSVPDPQGLHAHAAAAADQNARVRETLERMGMELVVVVELTQDAAGRVRDLVVLRPSGDPLFDAHIQRVAKKLDGLEGLPDHVAARNPHGVRTTWEFRGTYDFRKKLRDMDVENPADAAYLAAVGLGSLIAGGSFDEVTGDIYVIDVRDPKFKVRAKLLRLY